MRPQQVTEATPAPLCCVTAGKPLPSPVYRFSLLNGWGRGHFLLFSICCVCHHDSLFSCFQNRQSASSTVSSKMIQAGNLLG